MGGHLIVAISSGGDSAVKFIKTPIPGVNLIELERMADDPGICASTSHNEELRSKGLTSTLSQYNMSCCHLAGSVGALHFHAAPHEETEMVRVTRRRIFDVAVDLRTTSPTCRNAVP
jgi:dTDP-4-dehydrorhamnose 3,5-epimerase